MFSVTEKRKTLRNSISFLTASTCLSSIFRIVNFYGLFVLCIKGRHFFVLSWGWFLVGKMVFPLSSINNFPFYELLFPHCHIGFNCCFLFHISKKHVENENHLSANTAYKNSKISSSQNRNGRSGIRFMQKNCLHQNIAQFLFLSKLKAITS